MSFRFCFVLFYDTQTLCQKRKVGRDSKRRGLGFRNPAQLAGGQADAAWAGVAQQHSWVTCLADSVESCPGFRSHPRLLVGAGNLVFLERSRAVHCETEL